MLGGRQIVWFLGSILEELHFCKDKNKLDPIVVDLFIKMIESGEIEHYATNET